MMRSMDSKFSAASLFTAYTSLTAIVSLFQQFYTFSVPGPVREYIKSKLERWFKRLSTAKESFTLVVNQYTGDMRSHNTLYNACELYVSDKLRSSATRLTGCYTNLGEPISYQVAPGEEYLETLDGNNNNNGVVNLLWKFVCRNHKGEEDPSYSRCDDRSVELCFNLAYKTEVLEGHLPKVVKHYEETMDRRKEIHLFTMEGRHGPDWNSIKFNHPFTFDALALDPHLKQHIINDLGKFIKRKEFYNRVGRAWKRGYLLYGPPGTGKSSLVAAMANYLRFDIYDLQLGGVKDDATFRRLLLSTKNKSILVIEDVDCAMGLSRAYPMDDSDDDSDYDSDYHQHIRQTPGPEPNNTKELSLSGLLNFIDGLWSSCGDERIVVLTTNQKERLDPALLRPGRMDMHIHMSYLTMPAFRTLVNNYLGVTEEHVLFEEIEKLLQLVNATPAKVAEELIRSEDADIALSNVVQMLKKRLAPSPEKKMKKKKKNKKGNWKNNHQLSKEG